MGVTITDCKHARYFRSVTKSIPRKQPELLAPTLTDAKTIDGVWTQLNRTVRQRVAKIVPHKAVTQHSMCGVDGLEPRQHLFLEPAHLGDRRCGIGALEIDIDGADAERLQRPQIADNVGFGAGKTAASPRRRPCSAPPHHNA